MEQRFVVFDGGSELRIYKAPLNKTARLINEFPNRKPVVYENLKDAKDAALAIINQLAPQNGSCERQFQNLPRAASKHTNLE